MFRLRIPVTVVALLPLCLHSGCNDKEPAPEPTVRTVRAMKVADFEGLSLRSFPGRAKAIQEVDLAFRVAGPLVALPVKVGDTVKKGDLIARIDPRDFQVTVRNAEGSLERAKANRNRAQNDYARELRLFKRNAGSEADCRPRQRVSEGSGRQHLAGMAGRATGSASQWGDEQLNIVIPVTAVFSPQANEESFVWIIDHTSNTVGRRGVKIGQLVSGGFLIEEGLKLGEVIATAGANFLTDGQLV